MATNLFLEFHFEVVRHDILLKKLENAGIRGTILNWFRVKGSNVVTFSECSLNFCLVFS